MDYFLGVDGGQSHTTALIADTHGRIVGRGRAGASNHTRGPGGRERLERAVSESVGDALREAGLLQRGAIREFTFRSARLAMTGETADKIEIIHHLLTAEQLTVSHDSPSALAGALAGQSGIIVLAGTGSVAYGEVRRAGQVVREARVGGHGFLFGDEGSAFALARESLAFALHQEDRGLDDAQALKEALLLHFKRESLTAVAQECYVGELSRDQLASFTWRLDRLAQRGDEAAARLFERAADDLAEMAEAVAVKLGAARRVVRISYSGGVFKSRLVVRRFASAVRERLPKANVVTPRFGPEIGALLLAYQDAGRKVTERLLTNLND
jgi:N-acetylglucosamine kinase-like BadF-type ATPase